MMAAGRAILVFIVFLATCIGFACSGGDDDSYKTAADTADFNEFIDRAAKAVDKGDVAFFTDRVVGTTHTCTQAEVEASVDQPTAICGEVGQQFESAVINGYGSAGAVTTTDGVKSEIAAIFDEALPNEKDTRGGGKTRLYATAVDDRLQVPGQPTNTVLLTSLIDVAGVPGRTVVGVDFTWNGERWVIESILTANFPIASELLDATQAKVVYEEWKAFE